VEGRNLSGGRKCERMIGVDAKLFRVVGSKLRPARIYSSISTRLRPGGVLHNCERSHQRAGLAGAPLRPAFLGIDIPRARCVRAVDFDRRWRLFDGPCPLAGCQ
jgi:hypothetical protein